MTITLARDDLHRVTTLIRYCLDEGVIHRAEEEAYWHTFLQRAELDGKFALPHVGGAMAHLLEVFGGPTMTERDFDGALERLMRALVLGGDLEGAQMVQRAAKTLVAAPMNPATMDALGKMAGGGAGAGPAGDGKVKGTEVVEEGDASGILWHEPDAPVVPLILSRDLRPPMEKLLRDLRGIDRYLDRKIKAPTRVLMVGPPGTGKTTAAIWIAQQLGVRLAVVQLASVISSYRSRTQKNIAAILKAVADAKGAVFFDEWDALASRRDKEGPGTSEEAKHIMGAILQLLSQHPTGLLVMAATNVEQALDPAQKRRMPTRLVFGYPDMGARTELLTSFWRLCDVAPEARERLLAAGDGKSGDWLEVVAHAAARSALAIEGGDGVIQLPHVVEAVNETPVQDELGAPAAPRPRVSPGGVILT